MWRPGDWNNPNAEYHNAFKGIYSVQDAGYEAYEAGADAMLEALLDEGSIIVGHSNTITLPGFLTGLDEHVRSKGNGVWVFIPEMEG